VVEKYSPDDRWRVDTLITMLTIAGREATVEVQSSSVIYISRASEDVHAYATHKLLKAIRDDDGSQRGLLVVGIWCIGEYGDLVLSDYSYTPQGDANNLSPVSITFMAMTASSVVEAVENVIARHSCPESVKARALTCFAKLSDRFADKGDAVALDKLQKLLKKDQGSHSLELQLRSCEYDALMNAAKGIKLAPIKKPAAENDLFGVTEETPSGPVSASVISAAKEALSRMPVVDLKVLQKNKESFGGDGGSSTAMPTATAAAPAPGDDLLDIFGSTPAPAPAQNGGAPSGDTGKSDLDLLTDIFAASTAQPAAQPAMGGGGYDPFSAPPVQAAAPAAANPLDIFGAAPSQPAAAPANPLDIFGVSAPAPAAPMPPQNDIFGAPPPMQQQAPTAPVATPAAPAAAPADAGPITVPGITHQGLSIVFECSKPDIWNKQSSQLVAQFKNANVAALNGFNLQVAVPKYITMEMEPPTSTTIPPTQGANPKLVTQKIKVTNTMLGTKNLMLKVKISFTLNGSKVEHLATCSGFPAGQY